MSSVSTFATFEIKGVPVAAVSLPFACDFIASRASNACGAYVTVTGAHGIVESAYDERVREAHRQALIVVPDGMPLVWLGKLLGFGSMTRVYGPDLMTCVFENEQRRRLRHFFYGANPSVIRKFSEVLRQRFGEFNLVGTYSPPMQPLGYEESDEIIAQMRDVKPDLIWVALSTPKQELWMQMHMPRIGSGIAIGVGAAFALLSGATTQAPRWVQRSGLEWLFRLAIEPKRLYRRYFFVVPTYLRFFVVAVIKHHASRWMPT
jgi:N-acetylglucosaminyldiphosphoundecaprenol N-acetyl-beta-D-mannosaminyltransferase